MTFISEYPETCLALVSDWSRAASLCRLNQSESHTFQADTNQMQPTDCTALLSWLLVMNKKLSLYLHKCVIK